MPLYKLAINSECILNAHKNYELSKNSIIMLLLINWEGFYLGGALTSKNEFFFNKMHTLKKSHPRPRISWSKVFASERVYSKCRNFNENYKIINFLTFAKCLRISKHKKWINQDDLYAHHVVNQLKNERKKKRWYKNRIFYSGLCSASSTS